jgi:DNA mismatch repair protein MutS2
MNSRSNPSIGAATDGGSPPERSLEALDWPELCARLEGEARSARGRTACAALRDGTALAGDLAEAREALAEVAEAAALLAAGIDLPGLAFDDVEAQLVAAEKEMVLGPDELRPIAVLCECAAAVRRFLAQQEPDNRPAAPRLAQRAEALEPWERLGADIRATFDPAGEVRDGVSAELGRLRREREALGGRVRQEIERLMDDEAYASALQDRYWTIRQDRYVLPLRASAKSLGLGIVHDSSRTGETVFVEPGAVVELNNRLKLCDLAIAREIRRILAALARDVAAAAPALRADMAVLAELDVIAAKARLGRAYGGSVPALVDDTFIDLRQARHPLLTLRAAGGAFTVVPSDLLLGAGSGDGRAADGGARVLVVSGPNAGGKTVYLKTAGLAALLVRAGLPVPAAPGSRIGFFHLVTADVGDRQSVMGDLSTFSAHLGTVAEILRAVAAAPPGHRTLVLLDELMAGTNPEQGAALARATLEALAGAAGDVLVVATTHYDALKALGEDDRRFANAGMEYDLEHLVPTFRVRPGVPGRSYAFDIAARMGLPGALLERARALAGGTTVALEEVIATLEAREEALARETLRLERARVELEATAEDQRSAREALERRRRELAAGARAAIEDAVREAREAIRAIVRRAQEAGSARAAEAARAALAEAAAAAFREFPEGERGPGQAGAGAAAARAALAVGARVRVAPLGGAEGVVVRAPDERGRVKVTAGNVTVEVGREDLESAPPPPAAAPAARRGDVRRANARALVLAGGPAVAGVSGAAPAEEESLGWAVPSPANTLDLRGRRADEVRDAVEAYLDRAALDGRSPVFILHGHGTGALKKVVREYLAASPYVRRWAAGGKGQGGDGVTIVDL